MQLSILDESVRAHPNTWWWIKADGVDLVSGLGESVTGVWSGDVDMGDGQLQAAYQLHQERLHFLSGLGLNPCNVLSVILKTFKLLKYS